MKTIFIDAKSKADVNLSREQLSKLPKTVGIAMTIQHLHHMDDVLKQVPGSIPAGQVLGCDASAAKKISEEVDAFLYIGSGAFHPIEIAVETGKDVFCFNPLTKEMSKVGNKEIGKHEKRKQASILKFLHADKVGILVSTKPGQENMKKAIEISKRKDKEYFIFAFDTLNELDLENFPFIQCWVNTACPRIADGKPSIINAAELEGIGK